jgi:hypothetical protein
LQVVPVAAVVWLLALGTSGFAAQPWADDGTIVRLTTSTDSVGIGTETPSERLEVNGNVKCDTLKLDNGVIDFGAKTITKGQWCLTFADHISYCSNYDRIYLAAYTQIQDDLEVFEDVTCDTVRCNGVVMNGWTLDAPDYVFEPGYNLRPLAELEQHVKQHKHLPDVPSAAQIKQNGLDVAQMNMALLKKVEELTLYVIQQQKQISELKAQMDVR